MQTIENHKPWQAGYSAHLPLLVQVTCLLFRPFSNVCPEGQLALSVSLLTIFDMLSQVLPAKKVNVSGPNEQ